ncbi:MULTISPECIES: alkaline shock response membrane anchor protein AmaP [unclassified Streptomyces]|uniref:alkaline shock response membrane anchor protein AmaP n=1 Tax=unclassified Streptomyces TaxID=2593676 RepID=UPI002E147902|nr:MULTISPECIES: alkaline shock response membrane anchor protein AmaP [unclassified Streptomyces]WSR23584.1 alkaline shock response membrane anchor protein AmaP [Streptomyces sp. NBC_01205]
MKRQSAVNRTLLATAGIILLGMGLLILAGGFDLYRSWRMTPPDGWPLTTPADVLLSDADRTRWSGEGWWWPAVIAALVIVVLLALWWLLAQRRGPHPGPMTVADTTAVDGVELPEGALGDALAADAVRLRGVRQARARMTGRSRRPEADLDITLAPGTDPGPVLQELYDGPLERARQSTGRDLTARAYLRASSHKSHRVD